MGAPLTAEAKKLLSAISSLLVCRFGSRANLELEVLALPHRQRVPALRQSPGIAAKTPRLGPMRAAHRHRRQLTSRLRPHHLDFLSVGEEFGADALGRTPYMVEICGRGERYEENSAEVRP